MSTFFHGCGIPPVTMTCPPNTAMPGPCGVPPVTLGCNQGGGAQAQTVHGTAATLCTRIPACNQPIQTWFHTCGIPPVTITCNQGAGAQAQTIGNTGWRTCGIVGPTAYLTCPQGGAQAQNLGPTAYQGCPGQTGYERCGHTLATVCTQIACNQGGGLTAPDGTCTIVPPHTYYCQAGAQAQNLGPTAYEGCQVPNTSLLGCTTVTATPNAGAQNIGPTGWETCVQTVPPACYGPTGTEGCTVAPNCVGQTGWYTCHQGAGAQAQEHVTEYNHDCTMTCPGAGAQAQVPTIPVVNCIPTLHCTGAWPVC
ncbi:MAG: hypothetical protein HRT68_00570 [Flavobacteriaceae bacterium]|nr:hypothetical protein [Flavobacteriaceae bacterium]